MTDHKTVPLEPTEEMLCAAIKVAEETGWWQDCLVDAYKAMLEVAPEHVCEWTQDLSDHRWYATGCGVNLKVNGGYTYCPYCSGKIVEITDDL